MHSLGKPISCPNNLLRYFRLPLFPQCCWFILYPLSRTERKKFRKKRIQNIGYRTQQIESSPSRGAAGSSLRSDIKNPCTHTAFRLQMSPFLLRELQHSTEGRERQVKKREKKENTEDGIQKTESLNIEFRISNDEVEESAFSAFPSKDRRIFDICGFAFPLARTETQVVGNKNGNFEKIFYSFRAKRLRQRQHLQFCRFFNESCR